MKKENISEIDFKPMFPDFVSKEMKSGLLKRRIVLMKKNKVIIKERDEWSGLAEFLGNMIAKYADMMDFDELPDPDHYLKIRAIRDSYRIYSKERNNRVKSFSNIDFEIAA